MDNIESPIFY